MDHLKKNIRHIAKLCVEGSYNKEERMRLKLASTNYKTALWLITEHFEQCMKASQRLEKTADFLYHKVTGAYP